MAQGGFQAHFWLPLVLRYRLRKLMVRLPEATVVRGRYGCGFLLGDDWAGA